MQLNRLAVPSTRLPFVNSPLQYLPRKRLLGAMTYSGTGRDCGLHLIDVETLGVRKYRLPSGEKGAYGFVRGSDGNLYLGTFSGSLYRFDPRRTQLSLLASPFQKPDGEVDGIVWYGGASRAGRIYMGVYPTGAFCEYGIADGRLRLVHPMPPRNGMGFYCRDFIELPDARLLIFVGGAAPALFTYAPESGRPEPVRDAGDLPTFLAFEGMWDADHVLIRRDRQLLRFDWRRGRFAGPATDTPPEAIGGLARRRGIWYGVGYPSGTCYRLRGTRFEPVDWPVPLENGRPVQLVRGPGDDLLTLTDNGLFLRFDPCGRAPVRTCRARNHSRTGMEIAMLAARAGKRWIVGSHFINMQLFKVERHTGRTISSGHKVSGYSGQVTCGDWLGSQFFFASYGGAVLYRLDPAARFSPGRNPCVMGTIGQEQNRPVALLAHARRLFVATKANYGSLGGALSVCSPATGRIETYRHFVPNQNPNSLFLDAASGRLAGTTEVSADQGSAPPRATQAVVFVWDIMTRQMVGTAAPWETGWLSATAMSPKGVLIGFDTQHQFRFNVRTLCHETADWAHGPVRGGCFRDAHRLLALVPEGLVQLDLETGAVQRLDAPSDLDRIVPVGKREWICIRRQNEVWRLELPR